MDGSTPHFDLVQTKELAQKVLARFESEDVQKVWGGMREKGAGDMYYFFSEMVPWSTTTLAEITSPHGFSQTQQGAMQFFELVEGYKHQDHELEQIAEKIKIYFTQT